MDKVEKVLVCNGCSQRFTQRQNLHKHKQKCLKKVVVSCSVCKKVFSRTDALKSHKSTCEIRQNKFCSLYNKYFPTPCSYKRHLKQKHSKMIRSINVQIVGKNTFVKTFPKHIFVMVQIKSQ